MSGARVYSGLGLVMIIRDEWLRRRACDGLQFRVFQQEMSGFVGGFAMGWGWLLE